jgi:hypothetical protein
MVVIVPISIMVKGSTGRDAPFHRQTFSGVGTRRELFGVHRAIQKLLLPRIQRHVEQLLLGRGQRNMALVVVVIDIEKFISAVNPIEVDPGRFVPLGFARRCVVKVHIALIVAVGIPIAISARVFLPRIRLARLA